MSAEPALQRSKGNTFQKGMKGKPRAEYKLGDILEQSCTVEGVGMGSRDDTGTD